MGEAGEVGGQHASASWKSLGWARPQRPILPGCYSSKTDTQPRPRAGQPLGRGPSGKTSGQASNAKEVLRPPPTSLPGPAGSRKAQGAAGKLESRGRNPLQAVAFGLHQVRKLVLVRGTPWG